MKKTNLLKTLSILALASTAFVFAGCGKKKDKVTTSDEGNIKYDKTLKMQYKVFNGEAEILRIDPQGEELIIPSAIDGNVVKRMSCTYTDKELKKVTIPASLTYLNGNGFMECENLSQVVFDGESTLVSIPSKAFLGTKISSITIPASVRSISYEAFQNVDTLTSVTFAAGSKLTTIGPFSFYDCSGLTSITLPSNLEIISASAFEKCENLATLNISGATNLNTIDQYAFSGCEEITSLDFTSNKALKTIDANAFRGCTKMTSVTFNDALQTIGSKAFYNTQKMTSIVIPETVKYIGDEAFVNSGISVIEIKSGSDTTIGLNAFTQYELDGETLIPLSNHITTLTTNGNLSIQKIFTDYAPEVRKSLTTLHITGNKIAANAFKNCSKLVNLTIDNTVTAMGESAFEECVNIEAIQLNVGLTEIARNTFKNCVKLETVTLPNTVTIIRQGAFDGCVKVDLDLQKVTEIGDYAFRNTAIATPTFSENLAYIGEYAFDGCSNITEVSITATGAQIRKFAFTNCNNIVAIDLSGSTVVEASIFEGDTNVESIKVNGRYGVATLFGDSKENASKKINEIEIKAGTTTIEPYAFDGCLLVDNIVIPETVTEIGDYAFNGCKAITSLNLPEGLTKLGEYAFADCDKLVITELPENIKRISAGLFLNDASMGTFKITSGTTKIGDQAFMGCSNLNLEIVIANPTADPEDQITNIDSITSIGASAFSGCLNLTVSVLPKSIVEIGEKAFDGCLLVSINTTNTSVKRIGDYAFRGCKAITSFEFANDLGETNGLGNAILEGCTKVEELKIYGTTSLQRIFGESVVELKPVLSKITIKDGSKELADYMFAGFTAISAVTFEDGSKITKLGVSVFELCENLTAVPAELTNLKEVGDRAFASSGLTEITLPANGLILGREVFEGCASLAKCTFEFNADEASNNIKTIPNGTFANTILVTVDLPDSVTYIGEGAFSGIKTLKTVNITALSSLTEIGASAFEGCTNMLEIFIPKNVVKINDGAFKTCYALRTVEYSAECKIEVVNAETFYECYALTTINLPSTIRDIKESAFTSCECLYELELPTDLETIGKNAFEGAKSLNDLEIPEKVMAILECTFKDCKSLRNVIWNSNIKTIGEEAFYNTPYATAIPVTVGIIGRAAFASDDEEPKTFEEYDYDDDGVIDVVLLGCDTTNGASLSIGQDAFKNSAISKVKFGAKITDLGNSAFVKSLVESIDFTYLRITKIGDYMFDDCANLTTIVMKDTVAEVTNTSINTIGEAAFRRCVNLATFSFDNILSIGDSAFEEDEMLKVDVILGVDNNVSIGAKAFYKSGIKTLKLGAKVIKLGDNAFAETANLTSANLSALNITAISDSFFENCVALAEVSINVNIRTIGAKAFTNTAITSLGFLGSASQIEQIMDGAFMGCTALASANIPITVSYVGAEAFKGCQLLSTVTWSPSCNVINDNTFAGCGSLTSFTVLANVSRIGVNVFNAQGAQVITFLGTVAPSVDEKFCADNFANVTFKVPTGYAEVYKKNYVFAQHQELISES